MAFVPVYKYIVISKFEESSEDDKIVTAIVTRLSEDILTMQAANGSNYIAVGRKIYFNQFSAAKLPDGSYLIHVDDILGVDIPEEIKGE